MVAITIFWACAFAVFFFLLGVVCKGLAAAFQGLLNTIGEFIKYMAWAAIAVIVLFLIGLIVSSIAAGSLIELIGLVVVLLVVLAIGYFLVGWLGALIFAVALVAAEFILAFTEDLFESAAYYCEEAYSYFLSIIINRIEKC